MTKRDAQHARQPERRTPQRRLYTRDQLLGRAPIRLRRRSDKTRLVVHVLAVVLLIALTAWWVLPRHAFAGPVLFVIATGRGVHVGDLPSLAFFAVAIRSLRVIGHILRTPPA